MKKVLLLVVCLLIIASISYAADKDELQWKLRALFAESQIIQMQKEANDRAINEFVKELDAKGYFVDKGVVVEKPKSDKPKEPDKSKSK